MLEPTLYSCGVPYKRLAITHYKIGYSLIDAWYNEGQNYVTLPGNKRIFLDKLCEYVDNEDFRKYKRHISALFDRTSKEDHAFCDASLQDGLMKIGYIAFECGCFHAKSTLVDTVKTHEAEEMAIHMCLENTQCNVFTDAKYATIQHPRLFYKNRRHNLAHSIL